MSLSRVVSKVLRSGLGVALVATLLPAAISAADAPARTYIVTLQVADADAVIQPSNRAARQRIRQRAARTETATDRLAAKHTLKVRHRYEVALSGFSAKLTPAQAAELATDAQVASIRPARRFRVASQAVPRNIKRVMAAPSGAAGPDVDIDVAVLDTGIGPVGGNELNIAGGVNCSGEGHPLDYDDQSWHGTHVAGIIGARDNEIGVVGVAPGARLWSVRVFDSFDRGDESTIICGLEWATATRVSPGPGSIDVINMSLEGPRFGSKEGCGTTGDPIHKAVCAARAAGITMVVAAGNDGIDAKWISPAGYDQVITVGAMNDFDGVGWGKSKPNCLGYKSEKDDAYASYSNHGRDIDIVAPGTCILSTYPSIDGRDTIRMSGTSMAAPHVTGAVARYLAAHPTTKPEDMRRIVRASGRMDWNPKSDPVWSGIDDIDPPNRVLDVAALLGPQDLRVWIYRGTFKVKDKVNSIRRTRVDIQRGGGYGGDATLSVNGLPAAVGKATFDKSVLSSLTGLGTNVRLALKGKGPQGAYDLAVGAVGPGNDPSGSRTLKLMLDRTGPAVSRPTARLVGGVALPANGAAQARVQWTATDALSGVKKATLRRKPGKAAWRDVGSAAGGSLKVQLKAGRTDKLRVRATDKMGNSSQSKVTSVRLTLRDSKSTSLVRPASGGWKMKAAKQAVGGSLLLASKPAAGLTTKFNGYGFAIVAPVGPKRGTLHVSVDGGDPIEVSLKANKPAQRRVVLSRVVPKGSHTLEIVGFQGQTAIDAILILN